MAAGLIGTLAVNLLVPEFLALSHLGSLTSLPCLIRDMRDLVDLTQDPGKLSLTSHPLQTIDLHLFSSSRVLDRVFSS